MVGMHRLMSGKPSLDQAHCLASILSIYKDTLKNSHGDMQDQHSQLAGHQDMPLVSHPANWLMDAPRNLPLAMEGQTKSRESCRSWRASHWKALIAPRTLSWVNSLTLTVEIKSTLISVGTLNESVAAPFSIPSLNSTQNPFVESHAKARILIRCKVQSVTALLSPLATRRLTQICGGPINFTARH